MHDMETFEALLEEIRSQYLEASRMAALAETAQGLRPADNIGEIIREARGKQGLTQRELGELAGVTTVTLSRLENGYSSVQMNTLKDILSALGLKLWIG
ncbi:MAG: helix-turn-helix transcriptional regulator [Lysobacterales bacterium]